MQDSMPEFSEIHACKRLRERYGVEISENELWNITYAIAHNWKTEYESRLEWVQVLAQKRELWLVEYRGHWFPAVFDRGVQRIFTFLPKNAAPLYPPRY